MANPENSPSHRASFYYVDQLASAQDNLSQKKDEIRLSLVEHHKDFVHEL